MAKIEEHFRCSCSCILHTVRFAYWPEDQDKDENFIYIATCLDQWRGGIIPPRPFEFKELFTKQYWKYDVFESKIWGRIALAWKYIRGKEINENIFHATTFCSEDLDRLRIYLENHLMRNKFGEPDPVTKGYRYNLKFEIDEWEEYKGEMEVELYTVISFKDKVLSQRIRPALRYIFNRDYIGNGWFEMTPENAISLLQKVQKVQDKNKNEAVESTS